MTPIPQRIIIVSVIFLVIDRNRIVPIGTKDRRKALVMTEASPIRPGIIDIPITNDRVAPNDAPDDTPMV